MIVVDAMVLNYGLINHPHFSDEVEELRGNDASWIGPPIWRSEQRNALMQYVRASDPRIPRTDIDLGEAQSYMKDAEGWMKTLNVRSSVILRLAAESGCTAYDCEYVALAQRLGVRLVTYDNEVLEAFPNTAMTPSDFLSMDGD
jgi:predicted nucleic acid-binding protein